MHMKFNPILLLEEFKAAGLAVEGCSSFGRVDWVTPPSPEDQLKAAEILAKHDPEPPMLKRREALEKAGVTVPAMVEALWKQVVEGDSSAVQAVQARIELVRQEIPIPPG